MGLFGGSKEKFKIADFFSAEELKTITDTIEPKLKTGELGSIPQLTGKGLMDYIKRSDKEFSEGKMNSFFKIAGTVKDFFPQLADILDAGKQRFMNR